MPADMTDALSGVPTPGDLVWFAADGADAIAHPHVVLNVDESITLCALTTNLHRIAQPGNVLVEAGEGGLPKTSVVEVSKVAVAARAQLGAVIGTLSPARVAQIRAGIAFVQRSYFSG